MADERKEHTMVSLVKPVADACCIIGGPATGKTMELAHRARALVAAGSRSVVVVCATPVSAAAMTRLLEGNASTGDASIRITTVSDLAFSVVSEAPEAYCFGRVPHVLDAAEERVFLEDMKSCGLKRRRLRELLAFLYRGWSDLADEDPSWLCTTEEKNIVALMREVLAFTGGMLEYELANRAAKLVRTDAALCDRCAYDHVLVDDYGCLGRASQVLVNALARRSIVAAADDAAALPVGDPYPNEQGIGELLAANPQASVQRLTVCHRPAAVVSVLNRLRGGEALGVPALQAALTETFAGEHATDEAAGAAGSAVVASSIDMAVPAAVSVADASSSADVVSARMELGLVDEFRALCETVQQERTVDAGTPVPSVLIVGVNAVWRANAARALEACGVPVCRLGGNQQAIDFCNEECIAQTKASVIARLVRDEGDSVAWRTWCGFGDALAHSASVARLRSLVANSGLSFAEALRALAEGSLESASPDDPLLSGLAKSYHKGLCAIQAASGASNSVKPCVLGTFDTPDVTDEPSVPGTSDTPDAAQFSSASSSSRPCEADVYVAPHEQSAPGSNPVLLGAPAEAFGQSADLVIFGGFVNGFIPSRDYFDAGQMVGEARTRAHRADVQAVYLCASRARTKLLFSGFTSCGLEVGERLNLRIKRIRLVGGVRTCTVEPSELLELVL